MMNVPVIGFIPPVVGVDDSFNTFRLGHAFAKRLAPNQEVFLMDEKTKTVFGRAVVTDVSTGQLKQLCMLHGSKNHTELGKPDPENSPERLFAWIQKIYGPHIATEGKKSTVIYLRRLPNGVGTEGHSSHREEA
jgi:hypothetical protein